MKNWIARLFSKSEGPLEEKVRKISDLQQFDDVTIIADGKMLKAWVMKKTNRLLQIYVWESNKEIIINTGADNDNEVLLFDRNCHLILNKKDLCDYSL